MNARKRVALGLILTSLMVGCEMQDNAKKASENSGRAANAAEQSREEIANSRLLGRSGGASKARREAFQSMLEMESFEMKVTEAAKYHKAFEFQLWTGQKYETAQLLEELKDEAMCEFFRSLVEAFGNQDLKNSSINPISQNDIDYNVLALAVTLHKTHSVQKKVSVEQRSVFSENLTTYKVIADALRKIEKVRKQQLDFSELSKHEKVVYEYRLQAIKLLKGRIDMLMTMAIAKVSPLKDGIVSGVKLTVLGTSFDSKYMKLDLGEQYKVNKYIEYAIRTSKLLKELGIKYHMRSNIAGLYRNMKYNQLSRISVKERNRRYHPQAITNQKQFLEHLDFYFKTIQGQIK